MQYEYLKYLLVAISARHPQFRHTTKPANLNSPLTTRTTLLNDVHYLMSWNKDMVPGVRHRPYISNPICIPIVSMTGVLTIKLTGLKCVHYLMSWIKDEDHRRGSNPRPHDQESCALPLSYGGLGVWKDSNLRPCP